MALGRSIDFLPPRFFLKQFTIVVNIKQNICIYLYSSELDIQHTGAIIIVTILKRLLNSISFPKMWEVELGYSMVQMPPSVHNGELQSSCWLWDALPELVQKFKLHPRQAHPILLEFFTLPFLLRRP